MLVHHIQGLEENTMARMMYEEQKKNSWPGLADEVSIICSKLNVEDGNHTSLSKGVTGSWWTEPAGSWTRRR